MACISWPDGWQGALQHPLQGNGQMVGRASESLLNLPLSKLGKSVREPLNKSLSSARIKP